MNAATVDNRELLQARAQVGELPFSVLQRLKARTARGRWQSSPEIAGEMLQARLHEFFWGVSGSTLANEAGARIEEMLSLAAVVQPIPLAAERDSPVAAVQEHLPLAC